MLRICLISIAALFLSRVVAVSAADSGIIAKPSSLTVAETIDRVEALAKSRGLTIVARVDHSGAAEKAGLSMRPTQLLIVGSPKAGTPLMVAAPSVAIDLPLKVLAWQTADGKVWVGYNSPAFMMARHGLSVEQAKPFAAIGALVDDALK